MCSPKPDFLAIITAYTADPNEWDSSFKVRKQTEVPTNEVHALRRANEERSRTFHIDRKGYHLSLDAVPAWVCGQCGEPYFEEREVRTIQRLLSRLDKQTAGLASVA